ncbi:MAG TPA: translation initiation factor IF-2 N-terminal domain-containing protein, partial [Holophagaceae bacterium]|nr:translation initiation factor IF-2 N-terminal domain-containing protein [Holophagaceae bacterium]
MRINQLAKELGVSNHDLLEVVEKRLGLTGKSHSSSLDEDQVVQVRRVLGGKPADKAPARAQAPAPAAPPAAPAAVKVTKGPRLEKAAPSPAAPRTHEAPKAEPEKPAPILLKKAEPRQEAPE